MKVSIKDVVLDILLEEDDKPKESKKTKPGIEASTGSGRFSAGVNEAGALAKENPQQLMKNLKVSSAVGSDDLGKIQDLLKQAFTGADAMKTVYTGLSRVTKGEKVGLRIDVSKIKVRDGVKYLYHTLVGARSAGILKLNSLIQIENDTGSVVVYSGEKKTWK